jgi:hypothetical protein
MATFLLYSRAVVKKYLNSLLKTDVGLTSKYIRKNKKKYLINDIKEIIVKKTTKGCVREIKIKLNNTNTYINNSINNIDGFVIELQKYLPKEVVVKKISEPLDYDHPTFYFFFGILLSFVCINAIKLFFSLNSSNIPFISYIVSFFTIIMGIYFIVYKPIYKRDEKESQSADYILGIIFIIGALLVLILNIF